MKYVKSKVEYFLIHESERSQMELLFVGQNFGLTSLFDVCVGLIARVPFRLLSRLPHFSEFNAHTREAILLARVSKCDELVFNNYVKENKVKESSSSYCGGYSSKTAEATNRVLKEFWVTDLTDRRRNEFM